MARAIATARRLQAKREQDKESERERERESERASERASEREKERVGESESDSDSERVPHQHQQSAHCWAKQYHFFVIMQPRMYLQALGV